MSTESVTAYAPLPSEEVTSTIMVEVVAPSTMSAGYSFEAIHQGVTFTITVPEGGVEEGQTITVPFNPTSTSSGMVPVPHRSSLGIMPVPSEPGYWKDGLCDCCRHGICHASLCCAWCASPVLLSQIMTRLGLDWCASRATGPNGPKNTCCIVSSLFLTCILMWFMVTVVIPFSEDDFDEEDTDSAAYHIMVTINETLCICFVVYFGIILCRTRSALRKKHNMPEGPCGSMEDCCCACFCHCCTVAQMARQTANYETEPALCCSATGLRSNRGTEPAITLV